MTQRDAVWEQYSADNNSHWVMPLAKLTKESARPLAKAIAAKKDFISTFMIDQNEMVFKEDYSVLSALELCNRLVFLSCQETGLGDQGALAIQSFLLETKSCAMLVLSYNNFGPEGGARIAEGLKQNTSVKSLDLKGNPLEDKGVEYLSLALPLNNTLEELNLKKTGLGEGGEKFLADNMATNMTLNAIFYTQKTKLEALTTVLKRNKELMKEKFLRDLKGEHKGKWNRSKLMFIGQGRAGKTSTVKRLLNKGFHDAEDSTVGASVSQTQTSTTRRDNWKPLDPNDAAYLGQGMKQGRAVNAIAARNVVSKTNEELEEKEKKNEGEKKKEPKKLVEVNLEMDAVEIPEETPEDHNALSEEQLEAMNRQQEEDLQKKFGKYGGKHGLQFGDDKFADLFVEEEITTRFDSALFLEAQDSKETITFALWDYGGQTVFYALHHLFLTKYGIYVLCVDMREILNRPNVAEEYLRFWLNSVKLHAPEAPVFLVGTYLDEVDQKVDLTTVNDFVRDNFGGKYPQLVSFHDEFLFFPIDNKNNVNVNYLRGWIEKVSRDQEFVKAQVSLRWLGCLDKIMNMKNDQGHMPSWVSLTDVREISHRIGMTSESEIEDMLEMFHELGVLVRLTGTEDLRSIVTLDPQWLIDGLCRVIRDNRLHKLDDDEIAKVGLTKDVKQLYEKGLATRDLMEYLWKEDKFKKHVDFMLDLMKYMVLISDWSFREEPMYVVPSLLTPRPEHEDLFEKPELKEKLVRRIKNEFGDKLTDDELQQKVEEEEAKDREEETVGEYCVFDFSKLFLPMGVFQRLVCLCVSYSTMVGGDGGKKATEPDLYTRWAKIWMGNDTILYLEQVNDEIWVSVEYPDTAGSCLRAVNSMLGKLNEDLMGAGLKWEISFRKIRKTVKQKKGEAPSVIEVVESEVGYDKAKKKGLEPWFSSEKKSENNVFQTDLINLGDFVSQLMG